MQSKLIHDHYDSIVSEHGPLLAGAWARARAAMSASLANVCDRFARYRTAPLDFVADVLKRKLWAAQREIITGVLEHRRVTVRSCRKGGKTFGLGILVEVFINLWPCVVITVAPTHRQVKELLWGEINKLHAECGGKLLGKCDTMQLRVGPKHYALGFSTDKAGRFQGFHAGAEPPDDPDADLTPEEIAGRLRAALEGLGDNVRLLFIFDEAAEVAQPLYDAMEGSMNGPNAYLVLAGNPVMEETAEHEFARSHRADSDYHRIKITALEGYTDTLDSDVEFRVPNWLVDAEAIERHKRTWGESSPLFKAYDLGQFAGADSEWRVISPELLIAASVNNVQSDIGVHIGVDVSRAGKDFNIASRWAYGVKTAEHQWKTTEEEHHTMQSVTMIEALRVQWGVDDEPLPAENIHIDIGGLGGGIVDRLRQKGYSVDGVDFGAGPEEDWESLTGETAFYNRRAELHWIFKRALEEGVAKLPRHYTESWRQAQWPEYELRVRGGGTCVLIKPKDDIKKLHGRSPDNFDADLLAWSRSASNVIDYVGVY